MKEKKVRYGVARILSKRGACSRAFAMRACREGRVRVFGKIVLDPEAPTPLDAEISLDGNLISPTEKIYLAFYKPRGVVCTAKDECGRMSMMDFFPPSKFPHLFPIGRLDKASEGLILVTNDTLFADRLLSPSNHIEKVYRVQGEGNLTEENLKEMESGVEVSPRVFGQKSERMRAKRAEFLRKGKRRFWLEIVLEEGKNREIRRMLEKFDCKTLRLIRVKIGDEELGDLTPGKFRVLNPPK